MRLTNLILLIAACADPVGTNADPTVTAPLISPSPAFNDSTVVATASTQDPDGDAVTLSWSWRNDTRGADLGTGAQVVLNSAVASPNDVIVATVTATDAFGGENVAASQIVITNRAPLLGAAVVTPAVPVRASSLSCAAAASDDDGDDLAYTYGWSVNGAAAASDGARLAGKFAVDDVVACTVTVDDGRGGLISGDPVSVTITNASPEISAVTIEPAAPRYVGGVLTCLAEVDDADGDEVSTSYAWSDTLTGELLANGAPLALDPAQFQPGRSLTCTATAVDALGGGAQASSSVVVDNRAPTVAPVLGTNAPHPGASVVCDAGAADADGGVLTVSYSWENTTRGTNLGTAAELWVDPGAASVGDVLVCTVTAMDAQGLSASASASGTVANQAPTVTVSLTPAEPSENDVVRCGVEAEDPDGDALTITRDWTIDGVGVSDLVRVAVRSYGGRRGEEIVCTVTVTDALGAVTVGSASATLGSGPSTPDTADTAVVWPSLEGFTTFVQFAYDPATDTARGWTAEGVSHMPTFGFIFFNYDYRLTGDPHDSCLYLVEASAPLPRASWAYVGSAYLFGFEIDPFTATITTDCDAFFGDSASLWDFVSAGRWGAGVSEDLTVDMVGGLGYVGLSPSDYLGGVHHTDAPSLPSQEWDAYTRAYQLPPTFNAGAQVVPELAPALAHGPQTLNRGLFDSQTTTLWIFQ